MVTLSADALAELLGRQLKPMQDQMAAQQVQLKRWFEAELRKRDEAVAATAAEAAAQVQAAEAARAAAAAAAATAAEAARALQEQLLGALERAEAAARDAAEVGRQRRARERAGSSSAEGSGGGGGGAGGGVAELDRRLKEHMDAQLASEDILLQQRGAVTALGTAVERQGTEIASQLELQQKALALQLQMLQRMGAQVEAAAAAALEDARTKPKRGSAPHRPSYTQGTMVSDARVQMRH